MKLLKTKHNFGDEKKCLFFYFSFLDAWFSHSPYKTEFENIYHEKFHSLKIHLIQT